MKLLTLWPAPNVPGTNRYRTTITNEFDTRQEFVRADYNVSTNWSLTGRYLHDRVDSRGEYITTPDFTPGHRYQVGHLAVVEARHVRGRLLREFSYQLSTHELSSKDGMHTRGDLGILIPEVFPENRANLIPTIRVTGLNPIGSLPPSNPREYLNHTFSSALSWQHGTHTLKTGGLFTLEHVNSNLDRESDPGVVRVRVRRRIHGISKLPPRQLGRRMRRHAVPIPKQMSTSSTASGLDVMRRSFRIRGEFIRRSRSISGSATRFIRR